jgi:selenocysteine-specific elongation factor
VQLRFAEPLLLLPGDRFIVRQFSPVVTIGGGVVLDASPPVASGAPKTRSHFSRSCATVLRNKCWRARVTAGPSACASDDDPGEMNIRRKKRKAGRESGTGVVRSGAGCARRLRREEDRDVLQALKKFHDANPSRGRDEQGELRDRVRTGSEVFYGSAGKLAEEKKLQIAGELVHLLRPRRGHERRRSRIQEDHRAGVCLRRTEGSVAERSAGKPEG